MTIAAALVRLPLLDLGSSSLMLKYIHGVVYFEALSLTEFSVASYQDALLKLQHIVQSNKQPKTIPALQLFKHVAAKRSLHNNHFL